MKLNEVADFVGYGELYKNNGYVKPQDFQAALLAAGIPSVNFYQEMEMYSRYVNAHMDENRGGDIVQLHSHSFYEILYTQSGRIQYLLGDERYSLKQGDIVFVPPGLSHRPLISAPLEEPYRRYVLWISAEYIEQIRGISPGDNIVPSDGKILRTRGTSMGEILHQHFRQAVDENSRKAPGWQSALYAAALQTLVQLHRAFCDIRAHTPAAEKQELLDDVLGYIKSHLSDKITLKDTARKFLVSESTVSQLFRKRLGVSFYHCVTQYRLIEAKNLITDGVAPGSIYGRVGFADYSAFYRAFKQEYGMSPREYRSWRNTAAEETRRSLITADGSSAAGVTERQ